MSSKQWTVGYFESENKYSVIPDSWLISCGKMYISRWPKTGNIPESISKHAEYGNDWPTYPVKIVSQYYVMPRKRERVSNRGNDPDLMKRAAEMCINEGKSERSIAGNLGICHVSLNRYVKKLRATEFGGSPPKCGYRPHTRIFDVDKEKLLMCSQLM